MNLPYNFVMNGLAGEIIMLKRLWLLKMVVAGVEVDQALVASMLSALS